jgi:imidazolonepropionase
MQMIIALAGRQLKMTPAGSINAATLNAAYALDRGDKVGGIDVGKKAHVIILDIPNHQQPPYRFGVDLVAKVVKNGVLICLAQHAAESQGRFLLSELSKTTFTVR